MLEPRPNPLNIYWCNSCCRFMGKNMFARIQTDNLTGRCKKCQAVKAYIYCEQNRKKMRENTRRCAKENKDKRREYKRKYKKANRIDKKRKRHPTSIRKEMALVYKYARMLTKTTGMLHEVDHIIPTAKKGKHHEDNLQILTWKQNNKKADLVTFWKQMLTQFCQNSALLNLLTIFCQRVAFDFEIL